MDHHKDPFRNWNFVTDFKKSLERLLYLIHYDNLLQNTIAIIAKDRLLITKCKKFYYKMRQFTNCDDSIAKCDIYFKM